MACPSELKKIDSQSACKLQRADLDMVLARRVDGARLSTAMGIDGSGQVLKAAELSSGTSIALLARKLTELPPPLPGTHPLENGLVVIKARRHGLRSRCASRPHAYRSNM